MFKPSGTHKVCARKACITSTCKYPNITQIYGQPAGAPALLECVWPRSGQWTADLVLQSVGRCFAVCCHVVRRPRARPASLGLGPGTAKGQRCLQHMQPSVFQVRRQCQGLSMSKDWGLVVLLGARLFYDIPSPHHECPLPFAREPAEVGSGLKHSSCPQASPRRQALTSRPS